MAGESVGGRVTAGASGAPAELPRPFAPPLGKTALLIGQSGRRAHLDYVQSMQSVPAGGSVYAELYTGRFLSFEQAAFVDYLSQYFPGSLVEVGLSWKDNRVNAGYCDLSDPACVAAGGATAPELDIVAGKYDAALTTFAKTMQAYPMLKFLVRVDYEVSPSLHCAPADNRDCPAYRDAFRYLHRFWEQAGVSNVALVFHPTRGWAEQMYPGDDVTDWIAFSVFNHDLCLPTPEGENAGCAAGAHWDQNLAKDLAWADEQGKPLLIAESTVQKPSDESAAGFREYLTRLLEIADQHPQLRGLTYINMKWAGGWVYGEDWTQGAFGNVDARLARFPETRAFFCDQLVTGRFVSAQGAPLGCDAGGLPALSLPPEADAPTYERLVMLGSNRCAVAAEGAIVERDCAGLDVTGQARFRVRESGGRAQLWSDVTWLCWSAEGDEVVQRPCSDAAEQRFEIRSVGGASSDRDVTLSSADGRCVAARKDAPTGVRLGLAKCDGSALQMIRL
jgi:hypothetical protein